MLLIVGAALGLVAGLLTGGSLHNLTTRRLRWPVLVIGALLVKELLLRTPLGYTPAAPVIFSASLVVLIVWTLWHFAALPGIWVVSFGMDMNLVVVLANGGHMPVDPSAAHLGPAQFAQQGVWAQYAMMGPNTHLAWLGDFVFMPGPIGQALPQAYSPGDLVSLVGLTIVLFLATRPVKTPVRRQAITSL